MAIRSVLIAPQSDVEVAAAGTYIFVRVEKWTPANDGKLDDPRETTNTSIVTQNPRPGPQMFNFSGRARFYFDQSVHWFNMLMGNPVVTEDYLLAVGVQRHRFIPGGINPAPYTVQWKQSGSKGEFWRQSIGCKLKNIKLALMNNGGLGVEFQGMGRYALPISAPTVPADTTANYNQPAAMSQQALTIGGAPWRKPKKLDITVDNGLEADWSIQASRGYDRLKLGDTVMTGDIETFFDAYAGSIVEAQDSVSSLLSQIVLLVADTTVIGTGVTTVPKFIVTMPKPYVGDASEDDTNTDPEAKGSIKFGYNAAIASTATFDFINEVEEAIYDGS